MGAATTTKIIDQVRPTALGGIGIVMLSIVSSLLAYGRLGETVRIRWTIGNYPQYSPEHAPTVLVLTTFPIVIAGLYIGARGFRAYLERTQDVTDSDGVSTIIDICTFLLLGTGFVSQLAIILLNL